jgi:hypothetical protein
MGVGAGRAALVDMPMVPPEPLSKMAFAPLGAANADVAVAIRQALHTKATVHLKLNFLMIRTSTKSHYRTKPQCTGTL